MNLHNKYYKLREEVWKELENIVHTGCDYIGEFPIVVGEIVLDSTEKRSAVIIADKTDLIIYGVVKDENYSIFPKKKSDKDINVTTNKITVIKSDGVYVEVEPHLTDLQSLSTYLSGGFSAYGS